MKLRRIIATITVAAVFFLAPSTIPVKAVISVSPCGPFSWLAADTAFAQVIPCPVTGGTSSSAGVAAIGGFIGFVALLAAYDFVRRTTCIGDPWGLGGPGFSEPMPAAGSILPPQCKVAAYKGKRHRH